MFFLVKNSLIFFLTHFSAFEHNGSFWLPRFFTVQSEQMYTLTCSHVVGYLLCEYSVCAYCFNYYPFDHVTCICSLFHSTICFALHGTANFNCTGTFTEHLLCVCACVWVFPVNIDPSARLTLVCAGCLSVVRISLSPRVGARVDAFSTGT